VPRPGWRETVLSDETNPVRVPGERIEQRTRLRAGQPLVAATLIIRGDADTVDMLRRHAERTERAWALDGVPLLGVSVFAVLDMSLDDVLRRRFASPELDRLLAALGAPQANSQYARGKIWREED
jgi:hypothetical protein